MHPRRNEASLIVRVVEDEKIIFDPANDHIHQLNATAALVWDLCDGSRSAGEIEEAVARHFRTPRAMVAQDVDRLLKEFAARGLVCDSMAQSVARKRNVSA
ncbi:MAG: PqqD family protein [Gammaproteobacteria bacterium]|nr:PqqD family protein [Gammaproteobacteria bacterium]